MTDADLDAAREAIRERTPHVTDDLRKTTVNGRPALVADCAGECDGEIVVEEGDDPYGPGRYRNYFCSPSCL